MDPNPKNFPILSHILNRTFSIAKPGKEQHGEEKYEPAVQSEFVIKDPKMLAAMKHATADVVQTRSVLQALGPRPDHEAVDAAKARLMEIEATLSKTLGELVAMPRPDNVDREQWRVYLAKEEKGIREAVDKEKAKYKSVISLEEMHKSYEKLLKEAEEKLAKIYGTGEPSESVTEQAAKAINEEVVKTLEHARENKLDRVDLSGRKMGVLPPSFAKIQGLILLDVSNNQLKVIPDVISDLENLKELHASSNLLESLPDSLGKLQNLKILNVSGNKLSSVPDSICSCKSLVELDVSFNNLLYLPTNIGLELVNLQKLSFHLNKLRSLPSTISEMKCLKHLDAHFNEIRGLPSTIGRLTNLEVLNLSSNFADLKELPDSICELTNLKELDVSNNQIRVLPDRFGLLENLTKLNLEHNPIEVPPQSIAKAGAETVKAYMVKRRLDMLLEEEEKCMHEMQMKEQVAQGGWLTRSTSWLKSKVTDVGGNVAGYLGTVGNTGDPVIDAPR